MFEKLESRRLMTTTFDYVYLYVDGTDADDVINLSRNDAGSIVVDDNGELTEWDEASTYVIYVSAYGGNDTVIADPSLNTTLVVWPGAGDDTVQGGSAYNGIHDEDGNDLIYTGPSDDYVNAGYGDDTVYAGAGNDYLDGHGGHDYLYGEAGDDTINGEWLDADYWHDDSTHDFLDGGDGNDSLYGNDGDDEIWGQAGDDLVYGGTGFDFLFGGDGADLVSGDADNDYLEGGAGNDTITAGYGNDYAFADSGNDQVSGDGGNDTLIGGADHDLLHGNAGNDFLYGYAGVDDLHGDEGDDNLDGGLDADFFYGGAGNDTADFSSATTPLYITLDTYKNDTGFGTGIDNVNPLNDMEALIGGSANDTLIGSAGADRIDGRAGNDSLVGNTGNDTLFGGAGIDTLRGNNGHDLLYGEADADTLDGGTGDDLLSGGAGSDMVDYSASTAAIRANVNNVWDDGGNAVGLDNIQADVERVTGSNYNDWFTGSAADNTFYGAAGNDTMYGYGGSDYLFGGNPGAGAAANNGNDSMDGGDGNDYIRSGDYTAQTTLSGDLGNDTLIGSSGYETFWGGDGNDVMYGYAGNDTMHGHAGNDNMDGGEGNDSLDGWGGNDTLWGMAGHDTLKGWTGDDRLYGYTGSDKLYGEDNNDVLYGGDNDDSLYGGNGNDASYGEAGNDTIVSIDNATGDILSGGSGFDSFWADQSLLWIPYPVPFFDTITDADAGENKLGVNFVYGFANGADKTLNGDSITDPTDSGTTANFSTRPLFASTGPGKDDIYQGAVGDCYFMATLGATAKTHPNRIRQSVVDFGDGTFGVRFYRNNAPVYYRVDGDLPVDGGGGLRFARTGASTSIWAPIMEKAWTHFRTGANTYASLASGWMDEVFNALGSTNNWSVSWFDDGSQLLSHVANELAAGRAVTLATHRAVAGAMVPSHAYMVERVNYQYVAAFGIYVPISITLRNPWGRDGGATNDGAPNDGYVTVTGDEARWVFSAIQSATV